MLVILVFLGVLTIVGAFFLLHPQFGAVAKGDRLCRIQQSANFKDERFVNETPTTLATSKKGSFLKNILHFLFAVKPEHRIPKVGEIKVLRTDLKNLPKDKNLYVWFGHSSFLLQLDGTTILADPVFYKGSPVSFVNSPFEGTDYYKPKHMPDTIDYLLISHDHWDHLDYNTAIELRSRVNYVVCPLGVGADFEHWGYTKEQIIELDWNETNGWFHCLPTRHFTGRGIWNPKTLPASWLIQAPSFTVFFSGDGGYSERFERFGKQFNIDLAIMENGQYDERWSQIHTMPNQLGKAVKQLGSKHFITVHHSKFCLANHSWYEPRINEQNAAKEYDLNLITCEIGEVVNLELLR